MIRLTQLIKESPDLAYLESGKVLKHDNKDAYPFGYFKDELLIQHSGVHPELWKRGVKYKDELEDIGYKRQFSRRGYEYAGRLWVNSKLISFWEYPSPSKLKSIIQDINEASKREKFGFKIDNSWYIEVLIDIEKHKVVQQGKYFNFSERDLVGEEMPIPIGEYIGSKKRSIEDLIAQHVESPMVKGKREVPSGVGSKKRYSDMKPGETPAQYRARKTTSESVKGK